MSEPIDLGAAVTPPVVQVAGNEPTLIPNPIIPESAPPNPMVSPESPVVIDPSAPMIKPITITPVLVTEPQSGQPVVSPLTGQFPAPETETPANTVQPLQVTPGLADPNITFSQIEPGLKWAIANGLVTVDAAVAAYGEHLRVLLEAI